MKFLYWLMAASVTAFYVERCQSWYIAVVHSESCWFVSDSSHDVGVIPFFCKKNHYSFLDFSNLISSCAPIGIFLGRIANFINAELIGKPTNGNWGVVFNINDVPRHPSQLYEAFFEGLIIFFLIYFLYLKGFSKKINFFALFLIIYSISRFLIEFIREPDEHLGYLLFNLTMGQLLCLPMFLVGIIFLKYGKRN